MKGEKPSPLSGALFVPLYSSKAKGIFDMQLQLRDSLFSNTENQPELQPET